MLQYLPKAFGTALRATRPGLEKIAFNLSGLEAPTSIRLASPAFADGGAIPAPFAADGAGMSPPLEWSGVPAETSMLVLLVEDADSPTPRPLVHTIVFLPPGSRSLAANVLPGPAQAQRSHKMGRNSFFKTTYLPPDPPPGHGPHRYVFQLFAVDEIDVSSAAPGRSALLDAMRAHVVAKGCLTGTYERP